MWKDILARLPVSIRGALPFDETPDEDVHEPAAQNLWVPYALAAFLLLLVVGTFVLLYIIYF